MLKYQSKLSYVVPVYYFYSIVDSFDFNLKEESQPVVKLLACSLPHSDSFYNIGNYYCINLKNSEGRKVIIEEFESDKDAILYFKLKYPE